MAVVPGDGPLPCTSDTSGLMTTPLISVSRGGDHMQSLSNFFISSTLLHFFLLFGLSPLMMPNSYASVRGTSLFPSCSLERAQELCSAAGGSLLPSAPELGTRVTGDL